MQEWLRGCDKIRQQSGREQCLLSEERGRRGGRQTVWGLKCRDKQAGQLTALVCTLQFSSGL